MREYKRVRAGLYKSTDGRVIIEQRPFWGAYMWVAETTDFHPVTCDPVTTLKAAKVSAKWLV